MLTPQQFNKKKAFANYSVSIEDLPGKDKILRPHWILYRNLGQGKKAKALTWPWTEKDRYIPLSFVSHVLRYP